MITHKMHHRFACFYYVVLGDILVILFYLCAILVIYTEGKYDTNRIIDIFKFDDRNSFLGDEVLTWLR